MNQDDIIKMAKEYADEVTNGYGVVTYEFDLYGLEKFALLIRAAERERIIAANAPEIEKLNVYIKALEDAVAAERARLAQPDLAQVGEVGVWGQREWKGLTDEEMQLVAFSRAIEAKLKERNT